MIINSPLRPHARESKLHTTAKVRIAQLIYSELKDKKDKLCPDANNMMFIIEYEHTFPKIVTALGVRQYIADVFVQVICLGSTKEISNKCLCVEIDGKKGHWSKLNRLKDNVRDYSLLNLLQCPVVRFSTSWISGVKPTLRITKKKSRTKSKLPRKVITPMTDKEILDQLELRKHLFQ